MEIDVLAYLDPSLQYYNISGKTCNIIHPTTSAPTSDLAKDLTDDNNSSDIMDEILFASELGTEIETFTLATIVTTSALQVAMLTVPSAVSSAAGASRLVGKNYQMSCDLSCFL